jgi:hypothetical protein
MISLHLAQKKSGNEGAADVALKNQWLLRKRETPLSNTVCGHHIGSCPESRLPSIDEENK